MLRYLSTSRHSYRDLAGGEDLLVAAIECERELALVGYIGDFYNILEWVSKEEAEEIMREGL